MMVSEQKQVLNQTDKIKAKVCGKAILIGEHVVYGAKLAYH